MSSIRDGDNFGVSVAVRDEGGNNVTIVVGMRDYDHDVDEDGMVECGTATSAECGVGAAYVYYFVEATGFDVAKLLASDKSGGDRFGSAVAVSNDLVVIGAEGDTFDANGDGSEACGGTTDNSECAIGSAYLFGRNQGGTDTWGQVKKLLPSAGQFADGFGSSVAIANDTVALGKDSSDRGGQTKAFVSIFERNEGGADAWGETKKLSIEGMFNGFDAANVAVHDDVVVVGVPELNGDVNEDGTVDCKQEPLAFVGDECQTGGVFVFRRDEGGAKNFGLVKTFVATDIARENGVGRAVAFDGKTIVVGAAGFPVINGAVYVLE
jgi:FG-GAP repeat